MKDALTVLKTIIKQSHPPGDILEVQTLKISNEDRFPQWETSLHVKLPPTLNDAFSPLLGLVRVGVAVQVKVWGCSRWKCWAGPMCPRVHVEPADMCQAAIWVSAAEIYDLLSFLFDHKHSPTVYLLRLPSTPKRPTREPPLRLWEWKSQVLTEDQQVSVDEMRLLLSSLIDV